MAMFSNDIVESLSRCLKQAFNEHIARGGGKQKAAGQSACGRPEASVDSDDDALGQVVRWIFLYFHIHLHQHDVGRHVPCVPKASLESLPHSPPPFLSSLLSSTPQHGPARPPKRSPPPNPQRRPPSPAQRQPPRPTAPRIPNGGHAKGYPPAQAQAQGQGKGGGGGVSTRRWKMLMSFFATRGCGGSRTARRSLPRVDPPPKGETWVRFPGDEKLFGVPKDPKASQEVPREEKEGGSG